MFGWLKKSNIKKSSDDQSVAEKNVKEIIKLVTTHVSLVKNPATGMSFLTTKSENGEEDNSKQEFSLISSGLAIKSEEKKLVYGVVYAPDMVDKQNEFANEEVIEETAHKFLEDYRNLDVEHDKVTGIGSVVESYVAPSDMEINGTEVKKGSWVLVTKANDETWEKVKNGEVTGYSLMGIATKVSKTVDVENDTNKVVKKSVQEIIINAGIELFGVKFAEQFEASLDEETKKSFNTELANAENNDIDFYLRLLQYAIWDYNWNDSSETRKAKVIESTKQFLAKVESMTFEQITEDASKSVEPEKKIELVTKNQAEEMFVSKTVFDEMVSKNEKMIKNLEEIIDLVAKEAGSVKKSVSNLQSGLLESRQEPVRKNIQKANDEAHYGNGKYNLVDGNFHK